MNTGVSFKAADLLCSQQNMEIQLEDDLAQRYAKYALISKVRYTLKTGANIARYINKNVKTLLCEKENAFKATLNTSSDILLRTTTWMLCLEREKML